jgi:anti-sigma B factor antagonist
VNGPESEIPVVRAPRDIAGVSVPDLVVAAAPHLLGTGPGFVIDLSETRFINSRGLSELIRLGMDLQERGAVLTLAAATRSVARTMRTVGMDRVVPIFETVREAWAHIETTTRKGA